MRRFVLAGIVLSACGSVQEPSNVGSPANASGGSEATAGAGGVRNGQGVGGAITLQAGNEPSHGQGLGGASPERGDGGSPTGNGGTSAGQGGGGAVAGQGGGGAVAGQGGGGAVAGQGGGGVAGQGGGGAVAGQGGIATGGGGGPAGPSRGGTANRGGAAGAVGAGGTKGTGGGAAAAGAGGSSAGGQGGGAPAPTQTSGPYWGEAHSGNFWLGPVDYAETKFHNACNPPASVRGVYGNYLMGFANEVTLQGLKASQGQLCDVCVELTANGVTLIARAITYGQETGPNDIDVSPEADTALHGSTARTVQWRITTCPTTDPIRYTFDGGQWSNTWFFRVWVRNSKLPIKKVEYKLGSGAWSAAEWQSDGAFQAAGADFGAGFSLRVTAIDDQTIEDAITGLGVFDAGQGKLSHGNFK